MPHNATTAPSRAAIHKEDSPPPASTSGLERAIRVVNAVAESPSPGLGVSALAREVDLPKAVVHRILKSLVGQEFLKFDESTKLYSLGPGALVVGLSALRQLDVPGIAKPHLQHLVDETGETATLSMRQGWTRLYIDQTLSPQEVRMSVTIGRHYNLHAGSSSKAILAAMSEEEVHKYLTAHSLERSTDATIVDRAELEAEVRVIRERGYAISRGERQPDAGSVACAIHRLDGNVFGSVSVCGPVMRFDSAAQRRIGLLVKEVAAHISASIGYTP